MGKFISVAEVQDLNEGKGMAVKVNENLELALFKIGDKIYAIEEHCAHQGGPLSEGTVQNFVVMCPWHQMTYDIRTGKAAPGAWGQEYSVKAFNVKVENGEIKVEV